MKAQIKKLLANKKLVLHTDVVNGVHIYAFIKKELPNAHLDWVVNEICKHYRLNSSSNIFPSDEYGIYLLRKVEENVELINTPFSIEEGLDKCPEMVENDLDSLMTQVNGLMRGELYNKYNHKECPELFAEAVEFGCYEELQQWLKWQKSGLN